MLASVLCLLTVGCGGGEDAANEPSEPAASLTVELDPGEGKATSKWDSRVLASRRQPARPGGRLHGTVR